MHFVMSMSYLQKERAQILLQKRGERERERGCTVGCDSGRGGSRHRVVRRLPSSRSSASMVMAWAGQIASQSLQAMHLRGSPGRLCKVARPRGSRCREGSNDVRGQMPGGADAARGQMPRGRCTVPLPSGSGGGRARRETAGSNCSSRTDSSE